ncbi:hypothetical protein [Breoghania sp.]|uniref:hypothetical protein n=1 Tax=Breoghania sp. TaxID=2065378 RepID=UPI00262E549E|nr:hypothetical protein [Breoghania sp.]MDJ0931667.1 hypothetical protein [Breoghania sp.]
MNDEETIKYVIIMTDGEFNKYYEKADFSTNSSCQNQGMNFDDFNYETDKNLVMKASFDQTAWDWDWNSDD